MIHPRVTPAAFVGIALIVASLRGQQPERAPDQDSSRFRSGVELVNVTATVSDSTGRFVPGLQKEDFDVYEDDQRVDVAAFSAERVPVSLGVVLDTSTSMAGIRLQEAQGALSRFLFDLLDPQDEIFLYRFSNFPVLLQGWTSDRQRLSRALAGITAAGGTAMYDAVAEAIPLAQRGTHLKKAILVISDGNDTSSRTTPRQLKSLIRESEVLVYAIGIDSEPEPQPQYRRPPSTQPAPPRLPIPLPFPFPPARGRGRFQIVGGQSGASAPRGSIGDRVNADALRAMTDDSGGRTEIIHAAQDLNPTTTAIADELSRQYYLGYLAPEKKDGRWHSIRVDVHGGRYVVRARKGYVAS